MRDGALFEADAALERFRLPNNIVNVVIDGDTVTAPGNVFTGMKVGSVVRYAKPGFSTETYNKVAEVGVGGTNLTLEAIDADGVRGVAGVYESELVTGDPISVPMFIGAPFITGSGVLYAPLPNINVYRH